MNQSNSGSERPAAVRTENLWKVFEHDDIRVEAVRGVTFRVDPGEFVVLAGPSGSGKTTLLNLIGGLTRPTDGQVWVDGREIGSLPDRELAEIRLERLGFVFQAYNLLPVLTALENAEFTLLTSASLIDLMAELNRELGTTFVFATHDPQLMERARRNVRLVDGAIVADERRD